MSYSPIYLSGAAGCNQSFSGVNSMSVKPHQLVGMQRWLQYHGIETIILCSELYALDLWTYRDNDNKVCQAYEWTCIKDVSAARTFLGY